MVKQKRNSAEIEKRIFSRILEPDKKRKRRERKVKIRNRDKIIAFVICFVIIFFVFMCIYYYNMFIDLTYNIEANSAQIETQVQKRKNLIINLGKTVVDYSKHERELFTYLGELRANIPNSSPKDYLESLNKFNDQGTQFKNYADLGEDLANWEKTLSQLMAVAEQYPDLKLSDNFIKYMDAILEFENKIAELRMEYNISVNIYSTKKNQFPGSVFAAIFKFDEYPYFKLDIDENSFIYVEY